MFSLSGIELTISPVPDSETILFTYALTEMRGLIPQNGWQVVGYHISPRASPGLCFCLFCCWFHCYAVVTYCNMELNTCKFGCSFSLCLLSLFLSFFISSGRQISAECVYSVLLELRDLEKFGQHSVCYPGNLYVKHRSRIQKCKKNHLKGNMKMK